MLVIRWMFLLKSIESAGDYETKSDGLAVFRLFYRGWNYWKNGSSDSDGVAESQCAPRGADVYIGGSNQDPNRARDMKDPKETDSTELLKIAWSVIKKTGKTTETLGTRNFGSKPLILNNAKFSCSLYVLSEQGDSSNVGI